METDYGTRKVDDLGRIVMPTELRKKLGWATGNSVSIKENDGVVILRLSEKSESAT